MSQSSANGASLANSAWICELPGVTLVANKVLGQVLPCWASRSDLPSVEFSALASVALNNEKNINQDGEPGERAGMCVPTAESAAEQKKQY
jgi:hypothetical protein